MRHRLLILGALGLAALTVTAAAIASLTATGNISGAAGISMAMPGNQSFNDTLDGTDQTVQYSAVLGVTDARGTGAGWNPHDLRHPLQRRREPHARTGRRLGGLGLLRRR